MLFLILKIQQLYFFLKEQTLFSFPYVPATYLKLFIVGTLVESVDFKLILTETQNSLIKQYVGLLGTEKIDLTFEEDGVDTIAELATDINENVENIGARRLHTIMEKLLEDISYNASDIGPQKIHINKEYVEKNLGELIKSQDLSKFIL